MEKIVLHLIPPEFFTPFSAVVGHGVVFDGSFFNELKKVEEAGIKVSGTI